MRDVDDDKLFNCKLLFSTLKIEFTKGFLKRKRLLKRRFAHSLLNPVYVENPVRLIEEKIYSFDSLK